MSGKLYGVGVGPGDPELLTLKALRIIKEVDVIAVPGTDAKKSVAYQIVEGAFPELSEKMLLAVPMPMIKESDALKKAHDEGAEQIKKELDTGKNVAFLTLGDPTVYSTYLYIHKRVAEMGYETEIVSGIPSFCAVAAKLNTSNRKTRRTWAPNTQKVRVIVNGAPKRMSVCTRCLRSNKVERAL